MHSLDHKINYRQTLKKFFSLLALEKSGFFIVIVTGLISNVVMVATPFIMGIGIDRLINVLSLNQNASLNLVYQQLNGPLVLLGVLTLISTVSGYLQEYVMAHVSESVTLKLRMEVSNKMKRLPIQFYDNQQIGDIMSRMTSDIRRISDFLVANVNQYISSIIQVIGGLIMLFYLNAQLSIIIVITIVLIAIATSIIVKYNKRLSDLNQQKLGVLSATVEELYTGNVILKAFNMQDYAINKVTEANLEHYDVFKNSQFLDFAIYPAVRILNHLSFILSALFGAILVINGTMTIGLLQAYLQYTKQVSEPLASFTYVINALQNALAAIDRVYEILDSEEEIPDQAKTIKLENPKGAIQFDHVAFGYSSDKLLMKDINFNVNANEMVAIVGTSGAGKTTLVNLLMRFYEVNAGRILFDGVPIDQISRSDLRRLFGMVLQDSWNFEGTVAENISYGKPEATKEEVIYAAKAAQADYFIRTLPKGYDTVLSSEQNLLSQGQQQLLTIARVLVTDPVVVILDEATSSVDTRTEHEIQTAMNRMLKNRTSFVIAHRLSTIVNADKILVMENGDIVEYGTHEELLENQQVYANLYNSQFS
jgi:ATP-binding cassette subfamily B protein